VLREAARMDPLGNWVEGKMLQATKCFLQTPVTYGCFAILVHKKAGNETSSPDPGLERAVAHLGWSNGLSTKKAPVLKPLSSTIYSGWWFQPL